MLKHIPQKFSVFLVSIAFLAAGCALVPVKTPELSCTAIDWWEAGRTDGVAGLSMEKRNFSECQLSPTDFDLYVNGREAGLVDFCSPSQALAVGRSGAKYEKVCPENLEPAFLANYETGARIHALESENSDLQGRIDNLVQLMRKNSEGRALKNQIETLRIRRTQNTSVIVDLEANSLSF
ncbi:MAG TPA: DUF2799 domain-containing protein [Bdellovibrionales bacterium]|nr:DUF2799 domain-containing protein [Bdellovibrionales bacterium]